MKIQVEIPDKYANLAKAILLLKTDNDDVECLLNQAFDVCSNTVTVLDLGKMEISNEELKSLSVALVSFAISESVKRKE